jgi:hypothetical protein
MKKDLTLQEIVSRYTECSIKMEAAMLKSDYRTNNREAKKLNKLVAPLYSNKEFAMQVFNELLNSNSIKTRSHAGADCLRIGIHIKLAIDTLEELSNREGIGMTSFSSGMALKIYRGEF